MWGWLTLIFLLLKWITVAYTTTFTVATYVLLASLATQLGWYFVFVLLGSKCRKALQQELPFTKVLQTFWVGAVVCPVGVYIVRAAVGSMIAFVPGLATLARPRRLMFNEVSDTAESFPNTEGYRAQERGDELKRMTLAAAVVVAFFSAGLAEELAKVGFAATRLCSCSTKLALFYPKAVSIYVTLKTVLRTGKVLPVSIESP